MDTSKTLVVAFIVILAVLAGIWASVQVSRSKEEARLVVLFNQGKKLECNGIIVSQKEFNFVSGTLSFIGKPNTPYHGSTLSLEWCNELDSNK